MKTTLFRILLKKYSFFVANGKEWAIFKNQGEVRDDVEILPGCGLSAHSLPEGERVPQRSRTLPGFSASMAQLTWVSALLGREQGFTVSSLSGSLPSSLPTTSPADISISARADITVTKSPRVKTAGTVSAA